MTPLPPLPEDLAAALDDELDAIPDARLAPVVDRLIADYRAGRPGADGATSPRGVGRATGTRAPRTAGEPRGRGAATDRTTDAGRAPGTDVTRHGAGTPTGTPILRTADDAAAYAAYRMPATYAAVREALGRAAAVVPAPARLLDVGGGTGAAVWAAADVWPELRAATVLEGSEPVIALGRRLCATAISPAVRGTGFRRTRLGPGVELPEADLVTVSYVVGELDGATADALVAEAARRAPVVAVVEPGTPPGHRRVLAAREVLLGAGFTVVAPCPHDGLCPVQGDDWCHFAVRVNRSARHRRLKAGMRGHEDEKFSYVIATRGPAAHASHRIVRHPVQRKGLVTLRLCERDGALADRPVPRSRGDEFRAARDAAWGDTWPP